MLPAEALHDAADEVGVFGYFVADFGGGGVEDVGGAFGILVADGEAGLAGEEGLVVPDGAPEDLDGVG